MNEGTRKLVAVAIMRREARVWANGIHAGSPVTKVDAPREREHRHVRSAHHHHGHDTDSVDSDFYERIATQLSGATMTIMVGHGHGKANAMKAAMTYLEHKHPAIAGTVVGTLELDVEALSDDQILANVRDWYAQHREFV